MNISERAVESGKILRWLRELEENPLRYYEVELNDNASGKYAPLMLSEDYIAGKDLDPSIEMFELAEQKLILNMLIDGVIHQGENAAGCNWRLKLLGWYKTLSQEEKLALPVYGNKLSLTKAVEPVPGLESIKYGYNQYESVRLAYDEINGDLLSLGVTSTDYLTVKERIESKEEFVPQENALVDFKRLKMLDFATLDDLEKSSEGRPFNDLKHAFATASLGTASDSGASNYLEGFKWFTRFLAERGFTGTGRPCLRYWKERSEGGKLMHLDIFKADITWLTTSQSYAVAQIFEDIKTLTAPMRGSAPEAVRDKLFIWQSSARVSFMAIKSFATAKDGALGVAFAAYAKRKGLLDSAGQPLSLSPSRLRPSFISELVERDVPVREIQLILGHKHIETTLAYLDRMDFNHIARSKLDVALRELHESAAEAFDQGPNNDDEANLIDVVNLEGPQVVFKTPLASCRNIFNPPEFIKKLSTYVPGSPCALYNMCLGCENVLLTASNLPELFAMERDYLMLKEVSRIMDTPYGRVVRENLALLEGILHSKSDFTPEELAEGRRLSEFVDTTVLVDGVAM